MVTEKMTDTVRQLAADAWRDARRVRVLFVCLGNICRSPAAEGIMREMISANHAENLIEVDSCGTGGWHVGQLPDKRMRLHARDRGLELTHRCRKVDVEDFGYYDIIIGMDSGNTSDLMHMAPDVESARKVLPMAMFFDSGCRYDHVPDPYYEGAEGFELVLDLLTDGCRNLLDCLLIGEAEV